MSTFPVTITAQMRHGVLWEARQKLGSTKALADYLGMSQQDLGALINFKRAVGKRWLGSHGSRIEAQLTLLLERSIEIDDVFPVELMSESFQRKQKHIEHTFMVDPARLIEAGAMPALPPMPDEAVFNLEARDAIEAALLTLTPREEKIIRMLYGLGVSGKAHTFEEVSQHFAVTRERIRQIEAKALNKLRDPLRQESLKPFVEVNFPDKPKKKEAVKPRIEKGWVRAFDDEVRREWMPTLVSFECSPSKVISATEAYYRHADRVMFG